MRAQCVLLFLAFLGAMLVVGCSESYELPDDVLLLLYCAEGDLDAVESLLDKGVIANGGEDRKGLPLLAALENGHVAIADVLVANGADINALSDDGLSLHDQLTNSKHDRDDEGEKIQFGIDWLEDNEVRPPP